ncbi:MAG: hypothetical protein VB137_00545 [Burkholderia sp.]
MTNDDQLFVIVFMVMIFVETMARASARAVMPCSLKAGKIERFFAIRKSLHKPGGPYNGQSLLSQGFRMKKSVWQG